MSDKRCDRCGASPESPGPHHDQTCTLHISHYWEEIKQWLEFRVQQDRELEKSGFLRCGDCGRKVRMEDAWGIGKRKSCFIGMGGHYHNS